MNEKGVYRNKAHEEKSSKISEVKTHEENSPPLENKKEKDK